MAVPKITPNREIWAKEAVNTLPPLAASVALGKEPEPAPAAPEPAPIAKGKPRHK